MIKLICSLFLLLSLSTAGLLADSPKERLLRAQIAVLQSTLTAKDQEIRNLNARVYTLQATLDSTGKASQVLAKSNTELLQHNASIVASQTALVGQVAGEVASTKTAIIQAKVDSAKILQGVDTAKVAAVIAKRAVVIADKKRDDQHAEQQAATQTLINTADTITHQLVAEHALNQHISMTIVKVEGLVSGAQRVLLISLVILCIFVFTCFLLLRGQFKRRHSAS